MNLGDKTPADERVTLYMHLPKTGGSTLSHCLYQVEVRTSGRRDPKDRFYYRGIYHYPVGFYKDPETFFPPYVERALTRQDLRAVVGHFSYGIHTRIARRTGYVTMLRDPTERMLSLYSHLIEEEILLPSVSFADFLAGEFDEAWEADLRTWHPEPPPHSELVMRDLSKAIADNDQTRRIAGMEGPFGTCGVEALQAACANLERDFIVVGLTERFDESLVLMKRTLGWPRVPTYLPRLVNRRRPRLADVDGVGKDELLARTDVDRQLYGFAETLFDRQVEAAGPGFDHEVLEFRERNALHQERYKEYADNLGLV